MSCGGTSCAAQNKVKRKTREKEKKGAKEEYVDFISFRQILLDTNNFLSTHETYYTFFTILV